jgi:hypothetical protein
MDSSNSEEREERKERDEIDQPPAPREDEATSEPGTSSEAFQSDDWWRASAPESDWAQPVSSAAAVEIGQRKEAGTADVYFCGRTNLLPLNLAIRAIGKENLTGVLRACWEQEPVEVLARDGEIVLVTTRDVDLYCPETPDILRGVDVVVIERARDQQKENGTPFLLTLARNESIERQSALDLIRQHGQLLFSKLWSAPNVWIMFEKNAELLGGFGDVTGDPDVDDWSLETLRLVNPEQAGGFDPASIPAYTREGFDRVQKLKLTSDEAQFGSQFNGARSVQQIAKNLRLDLKSARQLLFRFIALEIVECWPASTIAKAEPKAGVGRFFGRGR